MNFNDFCDLTKHIDGQEISSKQSLVITYKNSKGEAFNISPDEIIEFLKYASANYKDIYSAWEGIASRKSKITQYEEKSYRAIYNTASTIETLKAISTTGKSQTKSLTAVISKVICFLCKCSFQKIEDCSFFDLNSINKALGNITENIDNLLAIKKDPASQKEAFVLWLSSKGLKPKTIEQYSGTCISTAESILNKNGIIFEFYMTSSVEESKHNFDILSKIQEWNDKNESGNGMYQTGIARYIDFLTNKRTITFCPLPKPFLLLAGISGTGKTRFVREQAGANAGNHGNFCQIAVRPDWHDPADLLGYTTRLSGKTEYVCTDVLHFMVRAWKAIIADIRDTSGRTADDQPVLDWHGHPLGTIPPFWLCLDEMNLAPVEQYFADYLSAIETRRWLHEAELDAYNRKTGQEHGYYYQCHPLLSGHLLASLDSEAAGKLRKELELEPDNALNDRIWSYFLQSGISIPFNLIVAGTVNMDETTHGFSRKVIDRAMTLDFGVFFPADLGTLSAPAWREKKLGYPIHSSVTPELLAGACAADPDARKTLAFFQAINETLGKTPFELAYRARNELLLALYCFQPADDESLMAIWDDFLMSKVLPRIEGDNEKLAAYTDDSTAPETILEQLAALLVENGDNRLPASWTGTRPDMLREAEDGQPPLTIRFRSPEKIRWMQSRLAANGFSSFWP